MEKKEENRWIEVNTKGPGYPRFCLRTEEKNFLLSWAAVSQIEASEDFLSIRFLCEYGDPFPMRIWNGSIVIDRTHAGFILVHADGASLDD